jgi:hypothetical protein
MDEDRRRLGLFEGHSCLERANEVKRFDHGAPTTEFVQLTHGSRQATDDQKHSTMTPESYKFASQT